MYFSCSVDGKSSKFQISRMRGKIFCDIPKRGDGTVGELVLKNPAPVPFHALTVWDAQQDDIRYVPCKRSGERKVDTFGVFLERFAQNGFLLSSL